MFLPVIACDFVAFDDPVYVTQNPHVKEGLTAEGIVWAIRSTTASNWHPLTWLSHMLDRELFGLDPRGHHFTSVLIHASSTGLLFVVLRRMTGALWPSAFVAALFGIHPLHVESVAWVAERKDVLCGLFWTAAMGSYVLYVERPGAARLVLAVSVFAVGLLAKPMLVTFPFVLLLLDVWPLDRFGATTRQPGALARPTARGLLLIREKIPFFVLAAASSAVTFAVQRRGGAMVSLGELPLSLRVSNALVAPVRYLSKTLWPAGLSVFYPMPQAIPIWQTLSCAVFLAAVSALVIAFGRRLPFIAVGWFWFLVTLFPVIGLVQVGDQSIADRYTYVPLIGVFILFSWGGVSAMERLRLPRLPAGLAAAAILLVLIPATVRQEAAWKSSETLYGRAIAADADNWLAHVSLGAVLAGRGRYDDAIEEYSRALRAKPDLAQAHDNMGAALANMGKTAEAIPHYEQALKLQPGSATTLFNFGNALAAQGRVEDAIARYTQALRLDPNLVAAHVNLGKLLANGGRFEEASEHYAAALRIDPGSAEAHYNLGNALAQQGRSDEAASRYAAALRSRPDFAEAHVNLGTLFYKNGRVDEAIAHLRSAVRIRPEDERAHNNLGTALVAKGDIDGGIAEYREALRLRSDYAEARKNLLLALERKERVANARAFQ